MSHRVQGDAEGVMRRHDPLPRHRLETEKARRVEPAGDVRRGRRRRRRVRRRLLRRMLRTRSLPATFRLWPVRERAARGLLQAGHCVLWLREAGKI